MRQHRTRNLEVPGSRSAPRNDALENRGLTDRFAKPRFEEIEVAAFIGLPDVPREHPAIAAFKPRLRLLPFGAALLQLRFTDVQIDAARGDVEGDLVAILHQR